MKHENIIYGILHAGFSGIIAFVGTSPESTMQEQEDRASIGATRKS